MCVCNKTTSAPLEVVFSLCVLSYGDVPGRKRYFACRNQKVKLKPWRAVRRATFRTLPRMDVTVTHDDDAENDANDDEDDGGSVRDDDESSQSGNE